MTNSRLLRHFQLSHATPEEIDQPSPADDLMPDAADRWVRCTTIEAPHQVVYRWLCQLTIAPYSFDFIDFPGRRSPHRLIPGTENLRIGQDFLIFSITGFETDHHIAGLSRPKFRDMYGEISVSYAVTSLSATTTRLRANACVSAGTPRIRRALLAVGDSIMAGRQLARLKRLCERTNPDEVEGIR